jgi:MMPL family
MSFFGGPDGDLGPGAEPELGQDAADVAVDGALGDEQPCSDLLVFLFLLALGEDYNILVMTRIREEADRVPLQ